ncbi:hypothetical protein [Virgibacillus salexigens]|uniref:hypothetical protein n=1 Tax=Virgibacillus TaxID=84406 RepID=UPI00157E3BA8|nr:MULTISPECIES: hypothetical protein [Virgibacillus]MYL41714.1 hypothetical protein [Virgibacillus massiliensis]
MEKEYIGKCDLCCDRIYFRSGLLYGIIESNHVLICFSCQEKNDVKGSEHCVISLGCTLKRTRSTH